MTDDPSEEHHPDASEPPLRREDARQRQVPRAGREGQETVPDARRRSGIRCAAREQERAHSRSQSLVEGALLDRVAEEFAAPLDQLSGGKP